MTDSVIIELLWQREERGLQALQTAYGNYLAKLAMNILSPQDAEECVNSALLAIWNAIPPQRPGSLRAFAGRIVRNLCLNRWNAQKAQKRDCGMTQLLGELEDALPDQTTPHQALEAKELGTRISIWLRRQDSEDRKLFLRRYWYGIPVKDLAEEREESPRAVASRLYRLRQSLRQYLEKEGITV